MRKCGLGAAASSWTAHLVVLPHTEVPADWTSPEAPSGMLLGRSDLPNLADRVRAAIERHGAGNAPLDPANVAPLLNFVAGGFPSQVEAHGSGRDLMCDTWAGAAMSPGRSRGTPVPPNLRSIS